MFFKHWLVLNENLSCLKYFVLKKIQQCVCVLLYIVVNKVFKQRFARCFQVLLALNIQTCCSVEMSMK